MKSLLNLFIILTFGFVFGQQNFQLADKNWEIVLPENYFQDVSIPMIEPTDSVDRQIVTIIKKEDDSLNQLIAMYIENNDLIKLTPAVYAQSFSKSLPGFFEQDGLTVITNEVELRKIDGINFYLISVRISQNDSDYVYHVDFYLTEIGGKEFNVTLFYDNDDDKEALENSFFNSKFK